MQRYFAFVSRAALAAACLALVPIGNAEALDYPTRQPHILVGYPPAVRPTFWRASLVTGSASGSASNSSSRTAPVPATISPPKRSSRRRPMATR